MATKHDLTREQMVYIIEHGGGVLIDHVIHTDVATLPSTAELAKGDPEAEKKAASDLDAQIAALQAQRATLDLSPQPEGPPAADDGKDNKNKKDKKDDGTPPPPPPPDNAPPA